MWLPSKAWMRTPRRPNGPSRCNPCPGTSVTYVSGLYSAQEKVTKEKCPGLMVSDTTIRDDSQSETATDETIIPPNF